MNTKIAILTTGDIFERRGFINAVISRAQHLQKASSGMTIDVYLFATYEPWLVRKLRHHEKNPRLSSVIVDGVKFNITWQRYSIFDYILRVRMGLPELFSPLFFHKQVSKFRNYDLISCHSLECGCLARMIKRRFGIPYVISWHGSDIHTLPFNNTYTLKSTKKVIEDASCNFFVSDALLRTSNEITAGGVKKVLYNGCSNIFTKYDAEKINNLKKQNKVTGKKIVGYVGNFMEIKNVLLLPNIFTHINKNISNVEFWLIGDGKLLPAVKEGCKHLPAKFWYGQPVSKMPDLMNMIDVLVLPSKNEGLPLVLTEALSCGTPAVSSQVGGCAEVIGKENTIPTESPTFCKEMAEAVEHILQHDTAHIQTLSSKFSWEASAQKEYNIILQILNNIA